MKLSIFQVVVLCFLVYFSFTGRLVVNVTDKVECYKMTVGECEAVVCGSSVQVDTTHAKIVRLK